VNSTTKKLIGTATPETYRSKLIDVVPLR